MSEKIALLCRHILIKKKKQIVLLITTSEDAARSIQMIFVRIIPVGIQR